MCIFRDIESELIRQKLQIASFDHQRPWGGFFVIEEKDAQKFSDIYFGSFDVESLRIAGKLSPKILIVKPEARLSWQYHHRRAETWCVVKGPVGVMRSLNDTESDVKKFTKGKTITLKKEERHRLIGLEDWGIVAEFWQHTNRTFISKEERIIRV